MSTYLELTVDQGTDPDIELTITQDGVAFDLTTASLVEFLVKPNRTTDDDDASVTVLTVGDGLTLTDGPGGVCVAAVPRAALATAGLLWWKLDAVVSGKRRTAMSGLLRVNDT